MVRRESSSFGTFVFYLDQVVHDVLTKAAWLICRYAIGGLAGGEDKASFWRVVAQCTAALPDNKPRYVMVSAGNASAYNRFAFSRSVLADG